MSTSIHERVLSILILTLCAIFFLNVGFASGSEIDRIDTKDKFSLEFKNAKILSYKGVDIDNTQILISQNNSDININVGDLEYPGSYVEFSIDIVNKGNIDAKVENLKVNGFENSKAIRFNLLNKSELYNTVLMPGESFTIRFQIEWDENFTDVSEEVLNFSIELPFNNI